MSFTSFLKSVGQNIAKATGVVQSAGAIASQALSTFAPGSKAAAEVDTFNSIVGSVVAVEGTVASIASSNATGADKARAAGNLVAQTILAAPFMQGKKIGDQAKFQAACATIAGGVADLLNSLQGG